MQNKLTGVIIGLVLLVGIGGWVYTNKNAKFDSDGDDSSENIVNTDTSTTVNSSTDTNTKATSYTLAQIYEHKDATSCWSAINGSVYDLTSWIPNHPGGERAILSLCGHDGSAAFNGQHGGSSKVVRVLSGFKIGNLAN